MIRSKLLLICLMSASLWTTAQTTDSLFQVQRGQKQALQQQGQKIEHTLNLYQCQVDDLQSQTNELYVSLQQKQRAIDSLTNMVTRNSEIIQATSDSLGVKIQTTGEAVTRNSDSLKSKTICGIGAFILALLASAFVWLLFKKGQKSSDDKIASLKKQADELNERIVGQFSNEMNELQKIGDVLKNAGATASMEPDHSLVKTLADRITFMEMTLYRMDYSVKGHKQLSKSIAQMKDNLLANGYEIVEMLGKEYDEGMRINASFVEDENIEQGKQIISAITKPQINYKGEIIQKAQVTVSQNV